MVVVGGGGSTYVYSDLWLIRLFSNPPKIVLEPIGADYRGLTVHVFALHAFLGAYTTKLYFTVMKYKTGRKYSI